MITKEALIITCTILGFLRIFYSIMGPKTIRIIKAPIVHSSLKPLQDQHLVGLVICSAKALERSERVAAKSEGLPVPQLPRKRQ